MKSLSFVFMAVALITFYAGCGKDNKSGGAPVNSPCADGLSLGTSEARFKSWYESNLEGNLPGVTGQRTETREVKTYSQSDGCELKPITIFGVNLGSMNYCLNVSKALKTESKTRNVNILPAMPKSSNSVLKGIYSGSGMTLINVSEVMYCPSYFFIQFRKPNGYLVVYEIDTKIHSAFNPVKITDSELRTVETLIKY